MAQVPNDSFTDCKASTRHAFTDFEIMNLHRDLGIQPMNGEIPTPVNIYAILTFIGKKIFKTKKVQNQTQAKSFNKIRENIGLQYFEEELHLNATEIDSFLFYVKSKHPKFQKDNYLDMLFLFNSEIGLYRKL